MTLIRPMLRHFVLRHLLLGVLVAAVAFAATPPARADTAAPVLLVVGDSISAAYGLPPGTGWVELLGVRLAANRYPHRVVNASITGDTTAGGRARLPALLARHKPVIVVLELGGNDGLRGGNLAATRDNLAAMVAASKSAGARVLIVGMKVPPNYGPAYVREFDALFASVAKDAEGPAGSVLLRRFRRAQRNVPAGPHPPVGRGAAAAPRQRLAHAAPSPRKAAMNAAASPRGGHTVQVGALADYPERIDVRSPSEFAEDHLPGAVSQPVLDDAERARIGTLHAQDSAFAARRAGAALVARNIAAMLEGAFADKPRDWAPLVYCWRGGQRSRSLAHMLNEIGWRAVQLEGGYRAYRRHVVAELAVRPAAFRYEVVCGLTGSGKSRLLAALAAEGAQVLDLEGLARHRGSLLGDLPEGEQPSQKSFDTQLLCALVRLDPARVVYVESESRKIGTVQVPDSLLTAMRAAECVRIDLPQPLRIELLKQEYAHFLDDRETLVARLRHLVPLHGKATVERWTAAAQAGDWDALVGELLDLHYDPTYRRSIGRNFPRIDDAIAVTVEALDDHAFRALARELDAQVQARFRGAMTMTTYAFRIVNVFAEAPLAGNPLAVFEDARGMDDATMQALALQFNLSETTFVLPSDQASARVRIFTPTFEMPFAGHPTLGTAHVVRALAGGGDAVTLEMRAGVIPVNARGDVWTLQANAPRHRAVSATRAELAAMLVLAEADVAPDPGAPPLWVDTGSEQLVIPLASADAVRRAAPRADLLHAHGHTGQRAMAYVFAPDSQQSTAGARTMVARFFFPKHGAVVEDPGTGSACANLGGWLIATGAPLPQRMTIAQGDAVGRPCRLGLEVTADRRIRVSGRVLELARGTVTL